MLLTGTEIMMKLLNKVSKFLENENVIFNLKEENSELREENELFKQFIDQLPDGFKLSWKLFKDLKG